MTLSVIRSIGTLDRTGVVQDALARIDAERFDELDVVRPGDLDECEVDVDVLLVGSKELTATGLRRIARWRRDHPVSVAIAHLNGSAMDKSELSTGGIAQAVRGPLTVAKLHTALHRADVALWDLLDAAERHHFSTSEEAAETTTESDEAPFDQGAEYDEGYADDDEVEAYDEVAYPVEAGYDISDDDSAEHEDEADFEVDTEFDVDTEFKAETVPTHTVAEITEEVTTAAGRFAGVIRGVIAEVTGAANGSANNHAPVALEEAPAWHTANGHSDTGVVVVPTQPTVAHDDLVRTSDDGLAAVVEFDDGYDDDLENDAHVGDIIALDDDVEAQSTWAGTAEAEDDAEQTYDARVVTIASATGGCGKTFFATSAATVLARLGWKVLLVDLDLQFGEVAAALQLHHPYSIYDGLYRANGQRLEAEEFGDHLADLVCHHELGFDVLAAPRDPALADYVGARDAGVVLDTVIPFYDVVLVDTPPSLNDVVIAALDRSDMVEVLATPDVPSLRNLTAFTDILRRLGLEDDRLRLILNKVEPDVGITVAQANEAFGGRFRIQLPTDRAVSRAVNRGTTVPVLEPRSKVSRAIVSAVTSMAHELELTPTPASLASAAPTETTNPPLRRLWRALSGGNP
ncbi:MAG TPA: AAA family ATPase [Mycobacteriales bacterium]|nr:AAA family ATPase [Mycobacteriales bacterium]